MRARLLALAAALSIAPACDEDGTVPEPPPSSLEETLRTERDAFGLITCSGRTERTTCFTNRSLVGISMGSGGAGQIGFSHPELFDMVGMLGISIVDWAYMLRLFERSFLGGFCDRETILANLARVNDPNGPAFCGPVRGSERYEPSGKTIEHDQDFNHFWMGTSGGGAIGLGRDWMRYAFQDIALAYGNPLYYNPDSPYLPPGVPLDLRAQRDSRRCHPPAVIRGLKHKEYNPTGEYDVIATCDTSTDTGNFDPARPSDQSFEVLLSVDYNRNGFRDYAEPILSMAHERYDDTGVQANDVYDPFDHPSGTAGNWLHDEGEPYADDGLDGVPGTGDYGEGNGRFDYSPGIANMFAQNPRMLIGRVPKEHLDRISIYADAGIRDFLGSAGGTNWMWGALVARLGKEAAPSYTRLESLPKLRETSGGFDFLAVDYRQEILGQYAYVRYGNPDASDGLIRRGDGDHVGTLDQAVDRLLVALSFVESRFRTRDAEQVDGELDITKHIVEASYHSDALGEDRSYGVALPPGYFDPANANRRYPVVYFMHGLGSNPNQLFASAILFLGYMQASSLPERSRAHQADWSKFIIIFPNSTCTTRCNSGTFNTNQTGLDGNGPRYQDAFFELMVHVDATYRVLPPVEVELPQ
jgi:hypothetical protein